MSNRFQIKKLGMILRIKRCLTGQLDHTTMKALKKAFAHLKRGGEINIEEYKQMVSMQNQMNQNNDIDNHSDKNYDDSHINMEGFDINNESCCKPGDCCDPDESCIKTGVCETSCGDKKDCKTQSECKDNTCSTEGLNNCGENSKDCNNQNEKDCKTQSECKDNTTKNLSDCGENSEDCNNQNEKKEVKNEKK